MSDTYQAIYLSPHLDDVALSCGGQIAQRTAAGERVLIVTVMAGDPPHEAFSDYVQSLHDRWQLATDAAAARRAEDLRACAVLGAEAHHLQVPDCIYRLDALTNQPFYVSDVDIFDQVAPAEIETLLAAVAEQFRQLPPARELYSPLSVVHRVSDQHAGSHVDHQLVRRAAELVFGERLAYYEDYPYIQEEGALARTLTEREQHWQPVVIPLTAEALERKIRAIQQFESQLSTFWQDETNLRAEVAGYAASVGGERYWRPQ
jgi:LmbE family N-acetylglucosaminyl deacetylase